MITKEWIEDDHGPRDSSSGDTTMQKQGRLYQNTSEVVSMVASSLMDGDPVIKLRL